MFDEASRKRLNPSTRKALLRLLVSTPRARGTTKGAQADRIESDPDSVVQGLDPASDRGVRKMVRFHLRAADQLEIMLGRRIEYFGPHHAFSFESDAMGGVFHFDFDEADDSWSGLWTDKEGEDEVAIETDLPTDPRALRAMGARRFASGIARRVLMTEGSFASESD